jgi:hypothetical protein
MDTKEKEIPHTEEVEIEVEIEILNTEEKGNFEIETEIEILDTEEKGNFEIETEIEKEILDMEEKGNFEIETEIEKEILDTEEKGNFEIERGTIEIRTGTIEIRTGTKIAKIDIGEKTCGTHFLIKMVTSVGQHPVYRVLKLHPVLLKNRLLIPIYHLRQQQSHQHLEVRVDRHAIR